MHIVNYKMHINVIESADIERSQRMTPTEDDDKDIAAKGYRRLKNNNVIKTVFLRNDGGGEIPVTVTINLKVNPPDGKEALPKTRFSFAPEKNVEVMEGRLPCQIGLNSPTRRRNPESLRDCPREQNNERGNNRNRADALLIAEWVRKRS